jgi:hypothetical protein
MRFPNNHQSLEVGDIVMYDPEAHVAPSAWRKSSRRWTLEVMDIKKVYGDTQIVAKVLDVDEISPEVIEVGLIELKPCSPVEIAKARCLLEG